MADYNTLINYNGDGTTRDFPIPFNYAVRTDIKVTRQNGTVSFTFLNPNLIRLSAPLAVGDILTIRRETNITNPSVSFVNGAVPTAQQFNSAFSQTLFAAQESNDTVNRGLFKDTLGRFDGKNARIINVADPVNPQDAATKAWAESSGSSFVAQAAGSAVNAAQSEADAASYANTADIAKTRAITEAISAINSATASATSATASAGSATNSANSATSSATSATASANSASAAATSATNAGTKAAEALTSANNAAASASAAATSATSAASSASTATAASTNVNVVTVGTDLAGFSLEPSRDLGLITDPVSPGPPATKGNIQTVAENIASVNTVSTNIAAVNTAASVAASITTNATAAQTAATNAAASATAAANSASAASTSAGTASTKATEAAASATAAASSASAASTSATNASTSATQVNAVAIRYIGASASNPATRTDGSALQAGDQYFNTTANETRVYTGSAWQAQAAVPDTMTYRTFTATAGQTSYTFSGASYRVGNTFVYVNGVLLSGVDYTATDGTNITFASALAAGNEVFIMSFKAVGAVSAGDIAGLGSLATKNTVESNDLASTLDLGIM